MEPARSRRTRSVPDEGRPPVADHTGASGKGRWLAAAALLPLAVVSCARQTGLVASVLTDLQAPAVLASVSLQVSSAGQAVFDNRDRPWPLGPGSTDRLPGTFSLYAEGGEPEVTLTVTGWGPAGTALVDRTASLRMVAGETLLIRLALTRSCLLASRGGTLAAPCPEGTTCSEGQCRSTQIDPGEVSPYASGSDQSVQCQGGSPYLDTTTGAPVPVSGSGGCPEGSRCSEGQCLSAGADGGPDAGVADAGLDAGDAPAPDGGLPFDCSSGLCVALVSPGVNAVYLGRPYEITSFTDGNLWIAGGGGSIPFVSVSGQFTIYGSAIPDGTTLAQAFGITAGPAGSLWITDCYPGTVQPHHQIYQVTPVPGDVPKLQAFAAPDPLCPLRIVAGPDGNLWFTSQDASVGRLTPAGEYTRFPVAGASSVGVVAPGITVGPDGNLWFASEAGIGRLTVDGAMTVFPVPTAAAEVAGITRGPDDNLWFVENRAGKVGRCTVDGVITEFPLPPNSPRDPRDITAGPDGNLWVTLGNQLARVTPAGDVTAYGLPMSTTSQSYGITTGPDGNLWFTAFDPGGSNGELGVVRMGGGP
jgi:virginiamycin B lyase